MKPGIIIILLTIVIILLASPVLIYLKLQDNRDFAERNSVYRPAANAWVQAVDNCIESRKEDGYAQSLCFDEIPVSHYIWLAEKFQEKVKEHDEANKKAATNVRPESE